MNVKILLAIAVPAALSVVYAQDLSFAGKWATPSQPTPVVMAIVDCRQGVPCSNPADIGHLYNQNPTKLNLNVDSSNGTVSGSLVFGSSFFKAGSGCGKLKIEEGRIAGGSLTFTTYRTVVGSRIPARWVGELNEAGTLTLKTLDMLPCDVGQSRLSPETGRPLQDSHTLRSDVSLVYRRNETSGDSKSNSLSAGKWWTASGGGHLVALDLKVDSERRLTGTVNLCGETDFKIAEGTVTGQTIAFKTITQKFNRTDVRSWEGSLLDQQTLRLSYPFAAPCAKPSSTTLAFTRSK